MNRKYLPAIILIVIGFILVLSSIIALVGGGKLIDFPISDKTRRPDIPIASAESIDGVCMVGINTTTTPGNGALNQKIPEAAQLGYGYMLVLTNTPADATAMAQRANQMCEQGIVPIMRACWTGSCEFQNGTEQGKFLKEIAKQATSCETFYGICGHNEPISEYFPPEAGADCEGEIDLTKNKPGFERCAKKRLFLEGQWSKACVTEVEREGRPANLKLTTSTFNGTIYNASQNLQNFSRGYGSLGADDFSCMAINTYTVTGSAGDPENPNEASAVYFADKFYSTSGTPFTRLPLCIMETDYFIEAPRQEAIQKNAKLIQQLMDSTKFKLQYVLGYNWVDVAGGWEWHALPDHGAGVLQSICGTSGSYDGSSVPNVPGGGSGDNGGGGNGDNNTPPPLPGGNDDPPGDNGGNGGTGQEYTCADLRLKLNYAGKSAFANNTEVTWDGKIPAPGNTAACVTASGAPVPNWRPAMYQLPENTKLNINNFSQPIFKGSTNSWQGFKAITTPVRFGSSYRFACVKVRSDSTLTGSFCEKLKITHKTEKTTCQAMDYTGPSGEPDQKLTLADLAGPQGLAANYGKECSNDKPANISGCGVWQDSDGNGKIDLIDLSRFAKSYNQSCLDLN